MLRPLHRVLYGTLVALCATAPTVVAVTPAAHAAQVGPSAAAARTGVVSVDGTLNVRSAPTTAAAAVGTVRDKARLRISCAVPGDLVRGTLRATRQWDRLASGRYVSHAFVRTAKAVPACRSAAVAGTVRSADGPVRLRGGPGTAYPTLGMVTDGTRLSLACAVTGDHVVGTAGGTTQWDRLVDGRYISHAYVRTGKLARCPGPAPAPPAPTMTNEQFIAHAVPGAQRGWREFGVPPSVTIAQAILESGWGRSELSAVGHNYFGIKCFGSPGPIAKGCQTYRTFECTKAGRCFPTSDTFRTYRVAADSFRDHGHFLRTNSRYAGAFRYSRDANAFLWRIWKAGYATDPKYYTKVTGLMTSYNLYRYDTWR
jgi:flagellar protein FlgJ